MTTMATMKLVEAVEKLSKLKRSHTLCVKRPWTADAECTVVEFEGKVEKATKAAGFEYFLEVHVALEVLEVFGKRKPTLDEKVRVLLFYAENDAWPDWVDG
jgi:hypothetical protein